MKKYIVKLLLIILGERRTFNLAVRTRRIRYRLGLISRLDDGAEEDGRASLPLPGVVALVEALTKARRLPGALTDAELERLYFAGSGMPSVTWFGAGAEAIQAATMLLAGGARSVKLGRSICDDLPDLVVVQNGAIVPANIQLADDVKVLRLDGALEAEARRARLRLNLKERGRLRVVLINDVGFQYGAGVATRRQVQSFLMAGWDVVMFCWDAGTSAAYPAVAKLQAPGRWLGVRSMTDIHSSAGLSDVEISKRILAAVHELSPDFVLVGNLHGANWPINILSDMRDAGYAVAAYMHDLHWATGRCAYPGSCQAYLRDGCDHNCPTAEQYPSLPRQQIYPAWLQRSEVFTGPRAIPLLVNSNWTKSIAKARFGNDAVIETVYLGLDHRQFSKLDRAYARRLLGIKTEIPLVLMGSINIKEERKGGPIFVSVLEQLHKRDDVGVIVFGHGSETLSCTKAFGLVTDEMIMTVIYSAADIFVSTAREEAFGQTLLEAAAVGLPTVAFKVGGIAEAVADGSSAILVEELTAEAIIEAIDRILTDNTLASTLGQEGERRSAELFSLSTQTDAWRACLARLF